MCKKDVKRGSKAPTVTGSTGIKTNAQSSMPKTVGTPPPPKPKE